jgi:hypothetical protein
MRTWIYNLVKNIAGMAAIVGDRVYSSTGVEDNDVPDRPFLMVHMGLEQPPLGMRVPEARAQEVPFDVVVHDEPGSMLSIDQACVLLKTALPAAAPAVVGGMSVYECRWEDTSGDGYDDHFKTVTRRVSFRLMTRR